MRPHHALLLLAVGCQEYTFTPDKEPPPEPEDTDLAPVEPGAPDIEVNMTEVNFGYLPKDCPAEEIRVRIANVGESDLDVTAIALEGPDSSIYVLDAAPRILAPGDTMPARLNFTPPGWEEYDRVRLSIASNDPDEANVRLPVFGAGAEDGRWDQRFFQTSPAPVDVLFVIDNSGSMSDEVDQLARSFNTFIRQFQNLGLDWRIAVTTTDMDAPAGAGMRGQFVGPIIDASTPDPVAEFTSQTNRGFNGSADEKGFDAARAALTAPLTNGANAGFLRTDANLSVVVVSDEDDYSGQSAQQFSQWLAGLKSPAPPLTGQDVTSFSGMVGPDGGAGQIIACGGLAGANASAAPKYHTAIDRSGGVWGDICTFQINPFLTFLAFRAAGLEFEFLLDHVPSSVAGIQVQVDGVNVPYGAANGWSYDARDNEVVLNGDAIPGPGAEIVITYPYATVCE